MVSLISFIEKNDLSLISLLSTQVDIQTSDKIKEWIITANFSNEELEKKINGLRLKKPIDVQLVTSENGNINQLFNKAAQQSKSDFFVCMQPGCFYYFQAYVKACYSKLKGSNCDVVACNEPYIFDYDFNTVIKLKNVDDFYTFPQCFAFKKSYWLNNAFNEKCPFLDLKTFTKNYTVKTSHLNAIDAMLYYHHYSSEKWLRLLICKLITHRKSMSDQRIHELVPNVVLQELEKQAIKEYKENIEEYDIIFYLGMNTPTFKAENVHSLNGSEQGVILISEELALLNYKVCVYGSFSNHTHNQVDYKNVREFAIKKLGSKKKQHVIFERKLGTEYLHALSVLNLKNKNVRYIGNYQDNDMIQFCYLKDCMETVDTVILRSQFHKLYAQIEEKYNDKIVIINNAVRKNKFFYDSTIKKNPNKIIWTSSYDRGLDKILALIWPVVKKEVPEAEFHIYYGRNMKLNNDLDNRLNELFKQEGVYEHGRVNADVLSQVKKEALFHIYYSDTYAETSCIALLESVECGCIPIISDMGLFSEIKGFHIEESPFKMESYETAAYKIVDLMRECQSEENQQKYIQDLLKNDILDWQETARIWKEKLFD